MRASEFEDYEDDHAAADPAAFDEGAEAAPDLAPAPRRSFAMALRETFSAKRIATAGGVALSLLAGIVWLDYEAEKAADFVNSSAAAKPQWAEINRPLALFSLAAPELERRARTYEARRHSPGGGRRDMIIYGAPGEAEPLIGVEIYRIGAEPAPARGFFVDMALAAGHSGLGVSRSDQPAPLTTRFGAFEAADLTLSGGGTDLTCLGFRLAPEEIALRIEGYACGAPGAPIDRIALGCLLDRIDLLSAGDDIELRAFFVEAERRRGAGCGPVAQARNGARTSWLEPGASAPPLRGGGEAALRKPRASVNN